MERKASVLMGDRRGPANQLGLSSISDPHSVKSLPWRLWNMSQGDGHKQSLAGEKTVSGRMLWRSCPQHGTRRDEPGPLELSLYSVEYLVAFSECGKFCLLPKVFVIVGHAIKWSASFSWV